MSYGGTPDLFMEIVRSNGSVISGESLDQVYQGHIEITRFSFSGPTHEASKGTGRKKQRDLKKLKNMTPEERDELLKQLSKEAMDESSENYTLTVEKEYDASSPELLESYSNNLTAQSDENMDLFQRVTVRCRIETASQADVVVLQMDFADAFVVQYDMSVSEEESIPTETIKFKFDKARLVYTPQTGAGEAANPPSEAGWDFKNKESWSG